MSSKLREISIFVGYPFSPDNKEFTKVQYQKEIEALLNQVRLEVNESMDDYELVTILEIEEYGQSLPKQIKEKINQAHLGIFDFTSIRPNVIFEYGYAVSRGIPTIICKSNSCLENIPSDIRDIVPAKYESLNSLRDVLKDETKRQIIKLLQNTSLHSKYFFDMWLPSSTNDMCIVGSNEIEKTNYASPDSDNHIFLDNFGDKDAILDCVTFMHKYYPQAKINFLPADDKNIDLESNLILIGGPGDEKEGNFITKEIMKEVGFKISYSTECESMVVDEISFNAQKLGGRISKDWGYFARIPNPYNRESTIILISGIHTFGVKGATMAFSDHPNSQVNFRTILERFNYCSPLYFECYFPVKVFNGKVMCPSIETNKIFPITI